MNKLLPIIPGCLCLIIKSNAGNTGTVTAIRRVDPSEVRRSALHRDHPRWEVDRPMKTVILLTNKPSPYGPTNHMPENYLMRIDGGETLTETEDELLEVKA